MGEKMGTTGLLIGGFVAVLLGLVLIGVLADSTQTATNLAQQTDTINVAGARFAKNDMAQNYSFHLTYGCPMAAADWRSSLGTSCQISTPLVTNVSNTMTLNTDYVLNATCDATTGVAEGDIAFVNATWQKRDGNLSTVTYNYCPAGYINSGWGKTVLNMVPGFFALGIFLGVIALVMFLLKKNEVFG